jgi:hypothetical protein
MIQPLFELEEGTSRGVILACLLKKVFKVCDVFIN